MEQFVMKFPEDVYVPLEMRLPLTHPKLYY